MKLKQIYEELIKGAGIEIDNTNGVGSTDTDMSPTAPHMVRYMTPDEFLKLVPNVQMESDKLESMWTMMQLVGVSSPYFKVYWVTIEDGWPILDGEVGAWKIDVHNGRHRMATLKKFVGVNVKVPVKLFPIDGVTMNDITPEMEVVRILPQVVPTGYL